MLRLTVVAPLIVLFSLVFSLLPSSISAQAHVAPTLTSATLDSLGLTVSLIWTAPSTECFIACWYNLYMDTADNMIDTYGFSTSYTTYYATINVNNSQVPNGAHIFFLTEGGVGSVDSGPSNSIKVTVQQPQTAPQGVVVAPGQIAGDPQFTGLRGQSYQVHGVPDEVFSIVSDVDLQYNSRFVLLKKGDCPTIEGKAVDTACFTHSGTYLGELAIETAAGDRVYIQAGAAATGFAQITQNDKEVLVGEHFALKPMAGRTHGYIRLLSSHRVVVQAGNFWFEFTNSDMFVNQRVAMIDAKQETSHGLLGQTWSTVIYDASSTIPWIEGSVFDYAMSDHQLFSHRFIFNRFQSAATTEDEAEESEEAEDAEEEEAKLLERLQRLTAARTRATGKTAGGKKAHTHGHVNEWDL